MYGSSGWYQKREICTYVKIGATHPRYNDGKYEELSKGRVRGVMPAYIRGFYVVRCIYVDT